MLSVKEISSRLSEKAGEVCMLLLPGGKRHGNEWITGDVTGSDGKSLHVKLDGEYVGHWRDWSTDEDRGDLLDLWRINKGITAAEAIKEAKEWLGIYDPVEARSEREYIKPPEDVNGLLGADGRAAKWFLEKRGIEVEILNRFKIEGNAQHQAIAFPCYAPSGNLVNRSYRTLATPKKVWQEKGCAPSLFGWHALNERAYKDATVILCEGQIDCMTWTQWGFDALSVPNGTGLSWIEYEWENLAAFDHIYLSFDMDGPGADMVENVMNRLGRHRCLLISLPKKDANDCLLAGYNGEDAEGWISRARIPGVKGLVRVVDLQQRILDDMKPKPLPYTLPFLKGKSSEGYDGYYPRPGEVTIWSGISHHGKSTFLNFFIANLLSVGHKVLLASMEMKVETLMRRMIYAYNTHSPSVEEITAFIKQFGHNMLLADKVGYIGQEELLEMMRYSYQRYGVQHVFVDSLMRIAKLEEEFVAQGDFLNILQEYAKTTNTHVHLVAHPRKTQERLSMQDLKGSSLLFNNADNVVFVMRNIEKERKYAEGSIDEIQYRDEYDTEIYVDKQRETGWIGSFFLKFDPIYYSYSIVKENDDDPREKS